MRVKKGFKARRRRNRILKLAKGYRGRRKNCYKRANQAVFGWRDVNGLETAVVVHCETTLTVRVPKQGDLQGSPVEKRVCLAGAEDVFVFVLG